MSVRTVDISVAGFPVPKHQPGSLKIKQRLGERGQCSFDIMHPLHVFTNQPTNDDIELVSSSDGDASQMVTIVGINTNDVRITDTVQLNGLVAVTSNPSPKWKTVYMVSKDADTVGTVTLREASGNLTITTLGPTQVFKIDTLPWENGDEMEVTTFTNQPVSDALEFFSDVDTDTAIAVTIIGTDAIGTLQFELTSTHGDDGTIVVTTSRNNWKTIYEVQIAPTMTGTLTVREASGNATVCTLYAGMRKNTDRLFGGIVENVKRSYKQRVDGGDSRVVWTITATDWRQVLDRRAVAKSYSGSPIETIITAIQADVTGSGKENFLTSWGGASTFTTGATLGDVVVQGITSEYSTVAEIFDECANAANAKWWIGQYKQIYMVLQSTHPGPFPVTIAANVFNVSELDTTSNYRNRQNVAYNALTESRTETLQSNDTEAQNTNSYLLENPVGEAPTITTDRPFGVGVTASNVASSGSVDQSIASSIGTAFTNNDTVGHTISVVSDDLGDTSIRVTLIGLAAGGADGTWGDSFDTDAVDGTNSVNYDAGTQYANSGVLQFSKLLAVYVDSAPGGTLTISHDGHGGQTITTIGSGTVNSGRITSGGMTNRLNRFTDILAVANNNTTKTVGLLCKNIAGNQADPTTTGPASSNGFISIDLNGTSQVNLFDGVSGQDESAEDIIEIYVGDVEANRTVVFTSPYEYYYGLGNIAISRTTNSYALGDNIAIVVTYKGTYPAVAVHNDATEQAVRAAAETGTGIWENSLITERYMTTAQADALALDLYNRWPSFARTFKFSTLTEGWYTGDFSAVTWEDFALAAVDMNATEISIAELPAASGVELQWTITLSNRTVFDGDASFFRALARKERATPNAERISTS